MKTPVIDGLLSAAMGYVDPELEVFAEEDTMKLDKLERLLKPLGLSQNDLNDLLEEVTNISASSRQSGFRSGFRLAARLMVESLGVAGDPEKGGAAYEPRLHIEKEGWFDMTQEYYINPPGIPTRLAGRKNWAMETLPPGLPWWFYGPPAASPAPGPGPRSPGRRAEADVQRGGGGGGPGRVPVTGVPADPPERFPAGEAPGTAADLR